MKIILQLHAAGNRAVSIPDSFQRIYHAAQNCVRGRRSLWNGACLRHIASGTVHGVGNTKGVLLGLEAATLYATVVLLNKKIVGVPVYEKTIVQLLSASIALIPYILLHGTLHPFELESLQLILLIAVGILHTGIAYALYFSSVEHLPVQTAALFSYIDPVTAVLLSALFLHETMTPAGMIGSVMIIGALLFLN